MGKGRQFTINEAPPPASQISIKRALSIIEAYTQEHGVGPRMDWLQDKSGIAWHIWLVAIDMGLIGIGPGGTYRILQSASPVKVYHISEPQEVQTVAKDWPPEPILRRMLAEGRNNWVGELLGVDSTTVLNRRRKLGMEPMSGTGTFQEQRNFGLRWKPVLELWRQGCSTEECLAPLKQEPNPEQLPTIEGLVQCDASCAYHDQDDNCLAPNKQRAWTLRTDHHGVYVPPCPEFTDEANLPSIADITGVYASASQEPPQVEGGTSDHPKAENASERPVEPQKVNRNQWPVNLCDTCLSRRVCRFATDGTAAMLNRDDYMAGIVRQVVTFCSECPEYRQEATA